MPYYKISYESNTIEGLKAIQGSLLGNGPGATDSNSFGSTAPPPPGDQDEGNVGTFSGVVPAPPTADKGDAGWDKNSFNPPPPTGAVSPVTDIGLEGENPPPPIDESQDLEGDEAQLNERSVPPQQTEPKRQKEPKKGSK